MTDAVILMRQTTPKKSSVGSGNDTPSNDPLNVDIKRY